MFNARLFILAAALLAVPVASHAEGAPTRIRGTIASLDGAMLHLRTSGGDAGVTLSAKLKVLALVPFAMADIKPGSFIGIAADTQADGSLVAKEVHVFPEAMRGTGEGHYAFDLGPKSTMTNGTVGNEVVGSAGNTLTVKYKGGEKPIVVPPTVPVVTFEPADRAELTPGSHVIVFAEKAADGALTSERVVVGRNGLTPPM